MNAKDKKMLVIRDKKAAALGEGSWRNKTTGKWCQTDVTFYPSKKLWITEDGKRREITLNQLKQQYDEMKV